MSQSNELLTVEVQSVQAIFPDAVSLVSDHEITVHCASEVILHIKMPPEYPSILPHFKLSAPSVNGEAKRALLSKLDKISMENRGEPMLYPLIETAMEEFVELRQKAGKINKERLADEEESDVTAADAPYPCSFHSGDPIEDRKSVFQAHVAKLTSKEQIPELLAQLRAVGKIARARHNPYAWRLVLRRKDEGEQQQHRGRGIEQHDCDDDGEDGASTKLMRLLIQMDISGVLVVVSRWKGGGKIGPDRFRHICNAARDALISGGFLKSSDKQTASG